MTQQNIRVARCEFCGGLFPSVYVEEKGKRYEVAVVPVPVQAYRKRAAILGISGQPLSGAGGVPRSPNDVFEPVVVLVPHKVSCSAQFPEGAAPINSALDESKLVEIDKNQPKEQTEN